MKKFSPLKNLIIRKMIVYSLHHQRTSETRRNLLIGYKNRSIWWSGPECLPAVGPIWFLSPRGKINSEIYNELILEPEIKVRAGSYSIMKNGSSNRTLPLLTPPMLPNRERAENIEFISKEEWPSSPDLNPLDYSIWGILQTRACAKPHKSLKSLQSALVREWQRMPQKELRDSVGQFRQRLSTVVKKRGGYIE